MLERRVEPRLLCADLIEIEWQDNSGRSRRVMANLEDISISGACLQLDGAIPLQTRVRIKYPSGDLHGLIRYCVFKEIGYFLGVQFDEGTRWSQKNFKPQHLFDPRRLAPKKQTRSKNARA
ncbi:MAG: PilZ domain-containing protein [Acidobacteriia bacterium]|nr:PilZ domain-containing protein [Terriglobia bacterium]